MRWFNSVNRSVLIKIHNMRFFSRRVVLTIITIFYSTLNALADVDGRWYSLDVESSPPSPFRMVVGGIICIVVGVFFCMAMSQQMVDF